MKTSPLNLDPKEAYRLFKMSLELANTLEDIFEENGSYSKEFLLGLNLSLRQAKAGKLQKINSLRELR